MIAVSSASFADWIAFAGGMSVKLSCNSAALEAWWHSVSSPDAIGHEHVTVCEAFK